jgi:hypothetical protein
MLIPCGHFLTCNFHTIWLNYDEIGWCSQLRSYKKLWPYHTISLNYSHFNPFYNCIPLGRQSAVYSYGQVASVNWNFSIGEGAVAECLLACFSGLCLKVLLQPPEFLSLDSAKGLTLLVENNLLYQFYWKYHCLWPSFIFDIPFSVLPKKSDWLNRSSS